MKQEAEEIIPLQRGPPKFKLTQCATSHVDLLEMAQMGSPTSLCRILLDQITDTKVHWEPLEDQHHLVHVEKDDESYEFK